MSEHNQTGTTPSVYTVAEIAKILRIGRNKAYALVHNKKLRSIRIGREYRIPRQCLDEWLISTNQQ